MHLEAISGKRLKKAFVIADEIELWDERPDLFGSDCERIGRYTSDVLSEFFWRRDKRACGRRRKWCRGHQRRWPGGWYQEEQISAARRFITRSDVEAGLEEFPGVVGYDLAVDDGALMGGLHLFLHELPRRLPLRFDAEMMFSSPGIPDLAFEIGFTGLQPDTELHNIVLWCDRWLQFYRATNLGAAIATDWG